MKQLALSVCCSGITVAGVSSSQGSLDISPCLRESHFLNHMQTSFVSACRPLPSYCLWRLALPLAAELKLTGFAGAHLCYGQGFGVGLEWGSRVCQDTWAQGTVLAQQRMRLTLIPSALGEEMWVMCS